MNNDGSPQRSALQNLVSENEKMINALNEVRRQKQELQRNLRRNEAQMKSFQIKLKTIENERQKNLIQNRRFIESIDQQKKERIKLLNQLTEARNLLSRKDAEIAQIKSQNTAFETQNERLKMQLQTTSQQQINAIKDRQATVNSVKILETKFEAAQMQKKFLNNKVGQLENQLQRVRQQLALMTKKYQEKELGVQAIYKDEQETKQRLLRQFQNKITDKDLEMKQELQRYLNQNSQLKQKIIQLRSGAF